MKVVKYLFASLSLLASGVGNAQTTSLKLREDNIDEIVAAMTVDEKAELLVGGGLKGMISNVIGWELGMRVPGCAGTTNKIDRLGIPEIVLTDGPAGLRISEKTTSFPCGVALASMRDEEMMERIGAALGNEAKEFGADILLGPGMNIMRNPLCGRNYEYYSEDPYLTGKTAAAYIRGVQSQGIGCAAKHFACNNQETGRKGHDARVDEQTLRNVYLKAFQMVVEEAEPWTFMTSYNKLNGVYTSENEWLLQTVLRDEWGFKGMVMTDWDDAHNTVAQVKAGNDMMMAGASSQKTDIKNGIKNGTLSMEALNKCVKRVLEMIVKTPTFKGYKFSKAPDFAAHQKLSRLAAAKSTVLLKNKNHTLPFTKEDYPKVALFGASAYDLIGGGIGSGSVNTPYKVHTYQGLENAGFVLDATLRKDYLSYAGWSGNRYSAGLMGLVGMGQGALKEKSITTSYIESAASRNDIAVITIGKQSGEENDRTVEDFNLVENERELITNVCNIFHGQGKKVVVVLNICGPIETASWKDMPDAIICPWLPGMEGGNAIADIITGAVSPSAKLPVTFPRSYADVPSQNFGNKDYTNYEEGEFVGLTYYNANPDKVSYAFGYGLTYTYGDVNCDGKVDVRDITVLVDILSGKDNNRANPDVNEDGTVNLEDVNELVRVIVGK